MITKIIQKNNTTIAIIFSKKVLITDTQSALDLVMDIKYKTNSSNIAMNKESIINDFFILRTGIAGEILQKFVNYGIRFAIYGNFEKYESKSLKDFMYESNKGKNIYFQPSLSLAINKLT